MSRLEFWFSHLMPYPDVPDGGDVESAWVTLPNALYDPSAGRRLFAEYVDQLVAAERLGYDGVCVEEHHQSAYGTMPAPNLVAAMVAARTEKIRIAVIGNSLPLQGNPLRTAEELAMLDVASGGRIVAGLVRGTGMDYYSSSANPAWSNERFWEALDLVVRAWSESGPFSWQGEHYDLQFVNPWPRPLQQPHPPVWLPGTGALEIIETAAERRYPFIMVLAAEWFMKAAFDAYREAADYDVEPSQLGAAIPTYVGDSDESAHREARPHVEWLFQTALKVPPYHWFPPGYLTRGSFERMLRAKAEHEMKDHWELSYDELVEQGYVIVGSADTVGERLTELTDAGAGILLGAGGHIGSMPYELTMESMQRMAEDVMPYFRAETGSGAR